MAVLFQRQKTLACGAALCCVLLAGCSSRPQPAASAPPLASQSSEQRTEERTRVLQAIQGMTPEQRVAYFKAHPMDASALVR